MAEFQAACLSAIKNVHFITVEADGGADPRIKLTKSTTKPLLRPLRVCQARGMSPKQPLIKRMESRDRKAAVKISSKTS